jgi:penicillin-binding protein 1A
VKPARFLVTFALIVVLGAVALGASTALLVPASRTFSNAVNLKPLDVRLKAQPQRSYVFDRNGKVMTTLFKEDRAPVRLEDVPQVLIDAVLAIEDRKFYEHGGFDVEGIVRAARTNVDEGEIEQGGSTITQQLLKNTINRGKERTTKLKIEEAFSAVRLENELTKDEILENYLNLAEFGHNSFGVEAASERYFNKTMFQLTLPEAAMLAGLLQAPSRLDPISHPGKAAFRRGIVLDVMVQTGKITQAEADEANATPLPTQVHYPQPSVRSYYIDAMIDSLVDPQTDDPGDPALVLGKTEESRRNKLLRGGLRIYTNYDPLMQYYANLAILNVIPQDQDQFTSALAAIDNSNGAVRAVAFGRGYDASQFNPAVDGLGRQAGSSFKGITLATALENGYSPEDRVGGYSLHWKLGPGDDYYNLSGDCHGGNPTLTEAIAISDNCAFVRTELSLGPGHYGQDGAQKVIDMANRMGVDTSNFQPVVSTTLGTNGVNTLDMAEAYSVIASDGIRHPASFVSKIVDANGRVLYETPTTGRRVLRSEVARTETQMLTEVLTNGTASGLSIDRPAAGKTGTTDQHVDAWFVGFTPQITTAVWMGDPNGETPMTNVGGISVWGASYPAEVWAEFMKAAHTFLPVEDFIAPNEDLWPDRQEIDELGRSDNDYYYDDTDYDAPDPTTVTTPPSTAATTPPSRPVGPTTPPIVSPTTSPPPRTVPNNPPPTNPQPQSPGPGP